MPVTDLLSFVERNVPLPEQTVLVDARRLVGTHPQLTVHSATPRPDHASRHDLHPGRVGVTVGEFGRVVRDLVNDPDADLPAAWLHVCDECYTFGSTTNLLATELSDAGDIVKMVKAAQSAVYRARAEDADWEHLATAVLELHKVGRTWASEPTKDATPYERAFIGWVRDQVERLWTDLRDARDALAARPGETEMLGPWVLVGLTDTPYVWQDSILPTKVLATNAGNILDGPAPLGGSTQLRTLLRIPTRRQQRNFPHHQFLVTDERVSDEDVALLPLALTLWQPDSAGPLADPGAALRAARDLTHQAAS